MARAGLLEVKLPPGVRPSNESTEMLIKKFLKECSKESLVQFLYENCAYTKRFEKRSVRERLKRNRYKKNARVHNQEINGEKLEEAPKKKKKTPQNKQ